MNYMRFFGRAAAPAALAALALAFAAPATAQTVQVQPQLAQGGPVAFSGLDCSRCGPGAFCVVNPLRFEYACAPQGTFACAGFQRTAYCPLGTTCWDGICR
jgi:hypothetical protein